MTERIIEALVGKNHSPELRLMATRIENMGGVVDHLDTDVFAALQPRLKEDPHGTTVRISGCSLASCVPNLAAVLINQGVRVKINLHDCRIDSTDTGSDVSAIRLFRRKRYFEYFGYRLAKHPLVELEGLGKIPPWIEILLRLITSF